MGEREELARVRAICLALPGAWERESHGSPTFFVGKRVFVMYLDNHHEDGRLALWCAAPEGAQGMLIEAEPEHFFRPPYVGHRGWLGVHLDRGLEWEEIASICEGAWSVIAPRRLVAERAEAAAGAARAPGVQAEQH